jgi:excisionase family DNA binding protein
MIDEWLTTQEAAETSGYHIEHIRRLVRDGQIKARKWGRDWMVNKISLYEYLEKDKKPGPKPSSNSGN